MHKQIKEPVDVFLKWKTAINGLEKRLAPYCLVWNDRLVEFELLGCIRKANVEAGISGLRYTIRLHNKHNATYRDTFLYLDGDSIETGKWFVVKQYPNH